MITEGREQSPISNDKEVREEQRDGGGSRSSELLGRSWHPHCVAEGVDCLEVSETKDARTDLREPWFPALPISSALRPKGGNPCYKRLGMAGCSVRLSSNDLEDRGRQGFLVGEGIPIDS